MERLKAIFNTQLSRILLRFSIPRSDTHNAKYLLVSTKTESLELQIINFYHLSLKIKWWYQHTRAGSRNAETDASDRDGSFHWCNKAQSRIVYRIYRRFSRANGFSGRPIVLLLLKDRRIMKSLRFRVTRSLWWTSSLSFYTHAKLQSLFTLITICSSHVAIMQNIIS